MNAPQIKGWLFNYYSITEKHDQHDNFNENNLQDQRRIERDATTKKIEE